jgi:hypothetical protein
LVELDDPVDAGVEQASVTGRRARSWPTVEDDNRDADRIAARLPVEALAFPDVQ